MIMVKLIFLVSTLVQENNLYGSVALLGLGFILMMLEDKLYDMFAYILYGGMMLLLLITPFLAEDTKGSLIHG